MCAMVARRLRPRAGLLLLPGLAIAAALYAFGREHTPDYSGTGLFGRTAVDTLSLKSWLATVVLALAAGQVALALWMYGRLRVASPARVPIVHRLAGATLLLLTLPIAYHCMFAYGVQTTDARIAVHSVAGCFLYGAFAAKVTVVRSRGLPGWMLPLAGGTLALLVALLWYTSSLWYFRDFSLPVL
jgi:Family of unknown function (DUF6529)